MNNKVAKLAARLDKIKTQLSASAMALYYMASCKMMAAMAFTMPDVSVNAAVNDVNASDMLGRAISLVLFVIIGFGIGVLIVGFVDVAQSFMSDQPEKRTRGFGLIVAGAIMIGLQSILRLAGIIA